MNSEKNHDIEDKLSALLDGENAAEEQEREEREAERRAREEARKAHEEARRVRAAERKAREEARRAHEEARKAKKQPVKRNGEKPQRAPQNSSKKAKGNIFKRAYEHIVTNSSLVQLIIRCVLMVAVPYGYLFLCGILDSYLLRSGFAYREEYILFVFFSLMIFWIIGFVLAGISIYRWCKRKNK